MANNRGSAGEIHKILGRRDITNMFTNWTPTLTWGTADPTGNVVIIARFSVNSGICFFNLSYEADDGNDASSLTITLPVKAREHGLYLPVLSYQKVNTTWSNPFGFLEHSNQLITFRGFSTCTNGAAAKIYVTGQYETR